MELIDTLVLGASYADCGEWGGHTEVMKIFRRKGEAFRIVYKRDTVNCPDPALFNRRIVEHKEDWLTPEQGNKVVSYVQEIAQLALQNEIGSNAGNVFCVSRKDIGLELHYSNHSLDWRGFDDLKRSVVP